MSGRECLNVLLVSLLVFGVISVCNAGENVKISTALRNNFYAGSCPNAEKIVEETVKSAAKSDPILGAKLLRLHYHDCFVRGCDGSVLLDVPNSEKEAIPLAGFEVIDAIKERLEKECSGIVSCADILALAARDGVAQQTNRLKRWEVLTGRRDGSISLKSDISGNMPSPFLEFEGLIGIFLKKGLNVKDLVVLSGAHTIGVAHCGSFAKRLSNFTGVGDSDPSLDPTYAAFLRKECPTPANPTKTVEMDPGGSTVFGNHYYTVVRQNKGLFHSDAALLKNKEAANIVKTLERSRSFSTEFVRSMKKMGAIELLTGDAGEIRKNCRFVNN